MTDDEPQQLTLRRTPDPVTPATAPTVTAAASAMVAAWLFDELGPDIVSVQVDADAVRLGVHTAGRPHARDRVAALLTDGRFAGWQVAAD